MSGHSHQAGGSPTGNNSSTSSFRQDRPRAISPVQTHQQPNSNIREQPGASQPTEQQPLTHLQYLEMQLRAQYQRVLDIVRQWIYAPQAPNAPLNMNLESIDWNNHQIVPRDFVEQARQNEAKLRDLREALNEKMEECDKIREHWQAAIGELSDLKSSKQIFMVDDTEMVSKWTQLQYIVKNLARTYLHNYISPKQLTLEQGELLKLTNPLYQEFLNSKGQFHLLFQSLVWQCIAAWILLSPSIVWGEELSAAFDTVIQAGKKSEEYHSWRAQTGEVIQGARGVDNQTKCQLQNDIYSIIVQFIPKTTLSNKKQVEHIQRSVERIVDRAIEIAVIFNQSRCVYRLRLVKHGERFSPRTMEYDEEECDERHVDLMISPGLRKYGNSKGENYDQRLVLVKSHVCTLKKDIREEQGSMVQGDGNSNKEIESLIEL